ncbi:MAG: hypothetical protein QME63_00945 [Actinomycetota bacterium]|nr:hypothetical protein [Actinomycetota bacterium]
MRRIVYLIAIVVVVAIIMTPALTLAKPSYVNQIPSGYTKSCSLCHTQAPELNSFGKQWLANGKKFKTTQPTTKPTTTTTTTKPAATTTKSTAKPSSAKPASTPKVSAASEARLQASIEFFGSLENYITAIKEKEKHGIPFTYPDAVGLAKQKYASQFGIASPAKTTTKPKTTPKATRPAKTTTKPKTTPKATTPAKTTTKPKTTPKPSPSPSSGGGGSAPGY